VKEVTCKKATSSNGVGVNVGGGCNAIYKWPYLPFGFTTTWILVR
jgi:hypothetical protein